MKDFSARWPRVSRWFQAVTQQDRFFPLAERSWAGLQQLRRRYIPLLEWEPRAKRKKSYWPELQQLETRMIPTLTVSGSGFGAVAGTGFPYTQSIASLSDPNGNQ